MKIGKQVKLLRTGCGLNQVEFSKMVKIPQPTLSKIENDLSTMTVPQLFRVLDVSFKKSQRFYVVFNDMYCISARSK